MRPRDNQGGCRFRGQDRVDGRGECCRGRDRGGERSVACRRRRGHETIKGGAVTDRDAWIRDRSGEMGLGLPTWTKPWDDQGGRHLRRQGLADGHGRCRRGQSCGKV